MYKLKNFFKKLFTKTFFVIFAICCALVLFFYWGWFEKQYDKALGMYYVYKGDKAYKHHELQRAIDYYNQGIALYPEHYGALFNLGNIYVVYEDYYSAADAYQKAIDYNKNFTLARMNLGIISSEKLGDFDGAIAQYQAIIDTKKKILSIPFIFNNRKSEKINKGIAYYNMGVAYKEKSIYVDDNVADKNIFLSKSIQAYKNAARILKKDYDTIYNLAVVYHLAGDFQNAGLNYCKAIELQPMEYEAHYNLAILLRHLKMYKEAQGELEKASILVSNSKTGSNTVSYIFDVLNDVSSSVNNNSDYEHIKERVDDEPTVSEGITYVNGKIVATEALDRAMLKNFRTCGSRDFFKEYGDKNDESSFSLY